MRAGGRQIVELPVSYNGLLYVSVARSKTDSAAGGNSPHHSRRRAVQLDQIRAMRHRVKGRKSNNQITVGLIDCDSIDTVHRRPGWVNLHGRDGADGGLHAVSIQRWPDLV